VARQSEPAFDPDILARLEADDEVRIETVDRRALDGQPRSTIIWLVVSDGDVFVRSVRGSRGRWYRDLQADASATLVARRAPGWPSVPVEAVPADDPASIARCSDALERKYAGDPALGSMLQPETLATTLRLRPRRVG
jgi:hypothetical protein